MWRLPLLFRRPHHLCSALARSAAQVQTLDKALDRAEWLFYENRWTTSRIDLIKKLAASPEDKKRESAASSDAAGPTALAPYGPSEAPSPYLSPRYVERVTLSETLSFRSFFSKVDLVEPQFGEVLTVTRLKKDPDRIIRSRVVVWGPVRGPFQGQAFGRRPPAPPPPPLPSSQCQP